jgi:ring-1,2-phenylacetyl-CoA epoxidase subunit PaaD
MIAGATSDANAVLVAVNAVEDPELAGVSIGNLGMVLGVRIHDGVATVDLGPTFLGCVAVGLIRLDIEHKALAADPSLTSCRVNIVHDTWSTDRISAEGVARLRALGISVITTGQTIADSSCPYCGRHTLEPRGGSGPTRCRSVAWCNACRNVVEVMAPKSDSRSQAGNYVHL